MSDDPKNLLLLLERPFQPSWFPRGKDGQTQLELPTRFIPEEYKDRGLNLDNRFQPGFTVRVDDTDTLPDLSFANDIDRHAAFSIFIPKHLEMAGKLTAMFIQAPDIKTLMSISTYAREHVNIYMFQYSFSVALSHREDTKNRKLK